MDLILETRRSWYDKKFKECYRARLKIKQIWIVSGLFVTPNNLTLSRTQMNVDF